MNGPVESTFPAKSFVQGIDMVGCGDQHHPSIFAKPIQLGEELIDDAVPFTIGKAPLVDAPANPVYFVDEQDARRFAACLSEQALYLLDANAIEHAAEAAAIRFDEVHATLICQRLGQERFAYAWVAGKQNPSRWSRVQQGEILWGPQPCGHVHQGSLCLIAPDHVLEGDLGCRFFLRIVR